MTRSSSSTNLFDIQTSSHASLRCKSRSLSLQAPLVMGILNVTPDSFSDGGKHYDLNAAIEGAMAMVEAGADIDDVSAITDHCLGVCECLVQGVVLTTIRE